MRVVIRVARMAAHQREYGQKFARAAADLVQDGHFLAIIHGETITIQSSVAKINGASDANGRHLDNGEYPEFTVAERENRALVSLLEEANLVAIGLRATDAGLVQLRKQPTINGAAGFRMEPARLHARWLEIICSNKGVPVLSNLASMAGAQEHLIDPDHMAAICATDWNADALIYLNEESGVPCAQGGTLRWFDINSSHDIQAATLSDQMRACLGAATMALKRGVRRVRLLPLSHVDCLSSFYYSSIAYGTEVIAGSPRMERSGAAAFSRY